MNSTNTSISGPLHDTKTPTISVLMCVYNTKKEWLCESIESILNQTYQDYEFIIVLDCPTDDSAQTVQSYAEKDKRIVVLSNSENIGLTKSLNKGLAIAKGDYIARMDADDVSLPTRFELQLKYMELHSEVAVVGSRVFTPGMDHAVQYAWTSDQEVLKIRLLFYNAGIPHPSAFIRRSILEKHHITYTETVRKSQDYKLWVDLIPYGSIMMLPDILLMYRVHENQITANPSFQKEYAHGIALSQAELLIGTMTEQEKLIHCWFNDPNHTDGGKKAYKEYIKRLLSANKKKKMYDQQKFKRELEFMWCQKAWRLATLNHKYSFLIDIKTLALLKPSVYYYTKIFMQSKAEYEMTIRQQTRSI